MFEIARRRQNGIAVAIVVVLALVLVMSYQLISRYTDWDMLSITGVFVLFTGAAYLLIRAVTRHTEAVMIHGMVAKGQIALARIDQVEPAGDVRDFCFGKHRLYAFDITVFTATGEEFAQTIIEDVALGAERPAPGTFVYVTYSGDRERMGIVPTINIFVSPQLKDTVRAFEETYRPRYMEVVRSNGLIFRPFKTK